jgi:hypothetical protein
LGGFGSTRWNEHNKNRCVEDCLTLDVDQLISAGLLNHQLGIIEWWSDRERTASVAFRLKPSDVPEILYLYLCYDVVRHGRTEIHEQPVPIEIRRQRIGKRYFLLCRLRRVRKLYRPTTQTLFGCRACHKLTYRSAQRHDKGTDIFRGNFDFLFAAVQAGSPKAILFIVRNLFALGRRDQFILKVVGHPFEF